MRLRAMEDLLESFMFDLEELTQRSGKVTELVTPGVIGKITKWYKSSGQWVKKRDILCQIEVIKPGKKPGETIEFVRSPAYGTLIIQREFGNVPAYIIRVDEPIAVIWTNYVFI